MTAHGARVSISHNSVFVPRGFQGFNGGRTRAEVLVDIVRQGHLPRGVTVLQTDYPRLLLEIPRAWPHADHNPLVRWVEVAAPADPAREAFERFERGLPMTISQVAIVLQVSERTVRRRLAPAELDGGAHRYSRAEVEALWRSAGNARSGGIATQRRAGSGSRSSTAGRAGGSSTPPSQDTDGSGRGSVEAVEKRLRAKQKRG